MSNLVPFGIVEVAKLTVRTMERLSRHLVSILLALRIVILAALPFLKSKR